MAVSQTPSHSIKPAPLGACVGQMEALENGVKGAWEAAGGWCSLGDGISGKTELPLKGLACLLFFASL